MRIRVKKTEKTEVVKPVVPVIVDNRTVEQKVDDLTKRFNRLIEAISKSKCVSGI